MMMMTRLRYHRHLFLNVRSKRTGFHHYFIVFNRFFIIFLYFIELFGARLILRLTFIRRLTFILGLTCIIMFLSNWGLTRNRGLWFNGGFFNCHSHLRHQVYFGFWCLGLLIFGLTIAGLHILIRYLIDRRYFSAGIILSGGWRFKRLLFVKFLLLEISIMHRFRCFVLLWLLLISHSLTYIISRLL